MTYNICTTPHYITSHHVRDALDLFLDLGSKRAKVMSIDSNNESILNGNPAFASDTYRHTDYLQTFQRAVITCFGPSRKWLYNTALP